MKIVAMALALAWLICPQSVKATSIVAYLSENGVVIGADSQISAGDGTQLRSRCKIKTANGIMWAASGFLNITVVRNGIPIRNFNVDKIAESIMLQSDDIEKKITRFEMVTKSALIGMSSLDGYKNYVRHYIPLEIVFSYMRNSTPALRKMSFVYKRRSDIEAGNMTVDTIDCTRAKCATPYVLLGEHHKIDEMIAANPSTFRGNSEKLITSLIGNQIAASPERVGPPISIAKLSNYGKTSIKCDSK